MLAAHQHRSRSSAAINHLLFGDVTRPNPSLAVPIAKKLHSLHTIGLVARLGSQYLHTDFRACQLGRANTITERDRTMTTSNNNKSIPVVEEIGSWTTTKRAAELMGVELASVGAIIHSGRVKACRIAGVFLVDKTSATEFGKKREELAAAALARETRNNRLLALSHLTDEQLEKVLAQIAADVVSDVTSE
jgi:hypothetical protein